VLCDTENRLTFTLSHTTSHSLSTHVCLLSYTQPLTLYRLIFAYSVTHNLSHYRLIFAYSVTHSLSHSINSPLLTQLQTTSLTLLTHLCLLSYTQPLKVFWLNFAYSLTYNLNLEMGNENFNFESFINFMKFMKLSLKFSLKYFNEIFTRQNFMKFSISNSIDSSFSHTQPLMLYHPC